METLVQIAHALYKYVDTLQMIEKEYCQTNKSEEI